MKKILTIIIFILFNISGNADEKIIPITEGKADAKVKIIVYESLTCSHCADFHKNVYPLLKEKYIENGFLRIEYRNFPLDLAALNASKIAHCNNDGNAEILHYLYNNQNKWVRGNTINDLNKNLKKLIVDSSFKLNFDKCIADKNLEDHILEERISGAKNFEIKATPTVIIMGEKFEKPLTYKNLVKYLEKLI